MLNNVVDVASLISLPLLYERGLMIVRILYFRNPSQCAHNAAKLISGLRPLGGSMQPDQGESSGKAAFLYWALIAAKCFSTPSSRLSPPMQSRTLVSLGVFRQKNQI